MQDRQRCPLCLRAGLVKYLQSYQINLEEAVVLCENKLCTYPLSQNSSVTTTFSRSFDDVVSKASEEKVKVPDAQLALQTKVASHMRKSGLRLQKDAIGIQTGSPQLKKKMKVQRLPYRKRGTTPVLMKQTGSDSYNNPLQLQNGSQSFQNFKSFTEKGHNIPGATECRTWASCNGSDGNSDKDSLLNSSGDSLESSSSASSNSSVGDNFNFLKKVNASYPSFHFGESKPRPNLPKSLPSFESLSSQHKRLDGHFLKDENEKLNNIPTSENVYPKTIETKADTIQAGFEVALSNIPKLNTTNQSQSSSLVDSTLHVHENNCKPVSRDVLVNKNETIVELQNCLSETAVVENRTDVIENSTSLLGNTSGLIGKSSCVVGNSTGVFGNSSGVVSRENLLRYPHVFPQWRNKDNLCWLDVVLCLAVHNETLKSYIFRESCDTENLIYKLFKAHNQACNLIQASQKNQTVNSSNVSAELPSPMNKIDEHSNATVNQVHQVNGVGKENIVTSDTGNTSACLDKSTVVETLLNEVREEVWTKLKSRLKCEKGQHESPVFTIPLVLKEEPGVDECFRMTYRFEYECSKCGKSEKTDHINTLPTFPAVVPDFNIGDPQHRKTCPQCGNTSDSRTMVYKKLPECLLMHFMEGLPDTTWGELQFGFHGYLYTVTGVVQYVNNPNHFIAWLRNPNDDKWFRCDDLRPTVCRKRIKEPKFPCKEIHIVMWERLQLKSRICRQVAVDTDDSPFENQEFEKNSKLVCLSGTELKLPESEREMASELSENLSSNRTKIVSKVKCTDLHSFHTLDTSPCSTRSTASSDSLLLPNFIASTPVSESVLRPIPMPIISTLSITFDKYDNCTGKISTVQEKTELNEMSQSDGSKIDDLIIGQKVKNPSVMDSLKAKLESRISNNVQDGQNKEDERKCQLNLPPSQISGPKTLIKPSTVFCVPKKSIASEKTPLSNGARIVDSTRALENKMDETVKQSVGTMSNMKLIECDSSIKPNEVKTVGLKKSLKGTADKIMNEIDLFHKQRDNVEKDCKMGVEKNVDIKKESIETKATKGRTSSRLSSRFKVPINFNKKTHISNISRDAFFTLETESRSRHSSSGESTPISVSASSSPALSGNLTYLNSVKQYLLSRTTGRTESKFKFEGLNLKSASSRNSSFSLSEFDIPVSSYTPSNGSELPAVCNSPSDNFDTQSLSDTSSHSSSISGKSALVNELIAKLEQSPMSGLQKHTTLKRKLESNASKSPKKRVPGAINEWDKMSSGNTSLKENARIHHRKNMPGGKSMKLVRNFVNNAEKAKMEQGNETKLDEGHTELINKVGEGSETKCDSESVLQDLYEALNIPFSNVTATMSDIMTDVDDILDFVNVGDVVPDLQQGDRPLSCLDGSSARNQKHSNWFGWARIEGLPKDCLWPVEVKEKVGRKWRVYVSSDDECYGVTKWSPLESEYERNKNISIRILRKKKLAGTLECFLKDLEFAEGIAPDGMTTTAPDGMTKTALDGMTTTAPDGKTTTALDGMTTTAPDDMTTTAPDGMTTTASDGIPDGMTTTAPDGMTTTASGGIPDGMTTTAPDGMTTTASDGIPDGMTTTAPDGMTATAPDGMTKTAPDGMTKTARDGMTTTAPDGMTTTASDGIPDGMSTTAPDGMTKTAPDGMTTTAPDGKTTTAPDGMTKTAPDGMTTTAPDGMTTTAPDGMTTTAPDGMTTTAPDGMTTTAPDGMTTTAPDGMTKTAPDGMTTTAPDGMTKTAPDGMTTTAPDGMTTTAPDGMTTTAPDGMTKTAPDGMTTTAPDGKTTTALDGMTTTAPDDMTTTAPDDMTTTASDGIPDGMTTTAPDGMTTTASGGIPDGMTTTAPDGMTTTASGGIPDGMTTTAPDGMTTTASVGIPDGMFTTAPDGMTKKAPDGMTTTAPDGMTKTAPDGTTTTASDGIPDGMTTTAPDGMTKTAPDGMTTTAPDGMTTTAPDGMTTTARDGMTATAPDGMTTTASDGIPDGMTTTAPDGMTKTAPDGMTTTAPGGMTTTAPDGMTTTARDGMTATAPDGMTTTAPDGMTTTASDGIPDGMTTTAPDGMTTTAPDGMTKTAPDGMTTTAPDGMTTTAPDCMTTTALDGMTATAQDGMTITAQDGMTTPVPDTVRAADNCLPHSLDSLSTTTAYNIISAALDSITPTAPDSMITTAADVMTSFQDGMDTTAPDDITTHDALIPSWSQDNLDEVGNAVRYLETLSAEDKNTVEHDSVILVSECEDSESDCSDNIPPIGKTIIQHLKSDSNDFDDSDHDDDDHTSDDDSDDEMLFTSVKRVSSFNLKETQIERDVTYPDIYIRKHLKSRVSVSGQSYKKKNDRVYNNYHCCFVCAQMVQHIRVHMKTHKTNPVVAEELAKIKPDFSKLRLMGDDKNNRKVVQSKQGEFVVSRRTSGRLDISMYGPCILCREWMLLSGLKKHFNQRCGKNKSPCRKKNIILKSRILAGHITGSASELMKNEVFKSMKLDHIGKVAQRDKLILALGESWLRRSLDNVAKRRYYTSEHMRLCARLHIALNNEVNSEEKDDNESDKEMHENDGDTQTMWDLLVPQNFDQIVNAALKCSLPVMDDLEDLKSPSNAIKLKYDIRRLVSAKYAYLLKEDIPEKGELKKCKRFMKLMEIEWSERVTKVARTVLQKRQLEMRKELPAPGDVEKLTRYLRQRLTEIELEPENFREIVKLCEARLLVYNKRRSGELEVVSLQNYASRRNDLSDLDESVADDLTVVEQQLLKNQELMTVRGKGGRPVPIIIPPEAVSPLSYIASSHVREAAGVPPGNNYLFPNSVDHYVRVYQTLQSFCNKLQLKAPGRITSVALRKYTATLSQMMNLDKYQMDWVCKHLGHTKSVHREAYRQMSGLVERVYIAKLMLVQDNNLSGKYKGADLHKIDVKDLVFPQDADTEVEDVAVEGDVAVEESLNDEMDVEDVEFVRNMRVDEGSAEEDNPDEDRVEQKKRKQHPGKGTAPKRQKQMWSKVEVQEIEQYFGTFLTSRICPRKKDVENAKQKSITSNGEIWRRSNDKIIKKISAMNHKKK